MNTHLQELQQRSSDLYKTLYSDKSTVSLKNRFIHFYEMDLLKQLSNVLNCADEANHIKELEEFFKNNWNRVKCTAFCYTALPERQTTQLLLSIAYYIRDVKNKELPVKEKIGALSILMPTVSTTSQSDKYPDLKPDECNNWTDILLETVLKTHIVGRNGNYLIPVACLNKWTPDAENEKFFNYYYDFERTEDNEFLNEEEEIRLKSHSHLTQKISDLKTEYEIIANDDTNLLGQIKKLLAALDLNSVRRRGTGKQADTNVYVTIDNFFKFYEKIDKNRIPTPIAKELSILKNAKFGSLNSCLATRHNQLAKAIAGHHPELNAISLNANDQATLLETCRKKLETALAVLKQRLNDRTYTGHDALDVSLEDAIKYKHLFQTDVLELLTLLKASDISKFCSNKEVQQKILYCFQDVNDLSTFFDKLSGEKLHAFVSSMKKLPIHSGEDLALIMTRYNSHLDLFWDQNKSCLNDLIKHSSDFIALYNVLNNADKKIELMTQLEGSAYRFICNPFDMYDTLEILTPEFRQSVLNVHLKTLKNPNNNEMKWCSFSSSVIDLYMGRVMSREAVIKLYEVWKTSTDYLLPWPTVAASYFRSFLKKHALNPIDIRGAFIWAVLPMLIEGLALLTALLAIACMVYTLTSLTNDRGMAVVGIVGSVFFALASAVLTIASLTIPLIILPVLAGRTAIFAGAIPLKAGHYILQTSLSFFKNHETQIVEPKEPADDRQKSSITNNNFSEQGITGLCMT